VTDERPDLRPALLPVTPLFDPGAATEPSVEPPRSTGGKLFRAVRVVFALWVFLSAINVMKTGAAELAPHLDGSWLTDSAHSALGFGWLGAMLVMSGSPVAVSAITFLDGGVLDQVQAFAMLTGSRLGASLVVLVVAGIYSVRTRPGTGVRTAATSIGIFALILSALVYIPAMLIAIPLLKSDFMASLLPAKHLQPPKVIDWLVGWVVDAVVGAVPGVLIFPVGLLLLLFAVRLIDRALPEASDAARLEENAGWRDRKWLMFGLGSLVALVTMSVSVALTVLVPAVAKGHFKRRQVVPYIMGANITTLGDTLLMALLVGNPLGIAVVLAEIVAISAVTFTLLLVLYRPMLGALVRVTDWLLDSKYRMLGFVGVITIVPIVLVAL
jgi:hypothetical protein